MEVSDYYYKKNKWDLKFNLYLLIKNVSQMRNLVVAMGNAYKKFGSAMVNQIVMMAQMKNAVNNLKDYITRQNSYI